MNISALRRDLADSLVELPVTVYAHLPGRAVFPSAVVLAGSPYLEQGLTFGSWTIRLEVWLSASKGDNGSETDTADELIQAAIDAIETYDSPLTDGWVVETVSQPFSWEINNGQAFTASITVTASGVTF